MKSGSCRAALWALVLLGALAPSLALLNIGCLFSPLLCVDGAELCYDDSAFGRCVGIDTDPNDAVFAKYDLGPEELQAFENEIESLTQRGYRWEHSYTQCVLQTMLFMVRDPKDFVDAEHCERFAKTDAMGISESLDSSPDEDIDSDEVAFVRFTPNGLSTGSDFANEVYAPPATLYEDMTEDMPAHVPETGNGNEAVEEEIRELLDPDFDPEPIQFQGFRERVNAAKENQIRNEVEDNEYNEQIAKIKKSMQTEMDKSLLDPAESVYLDEERQRLGKLHANSQPHTVEYITSNRLSPQEVKFLLDKYRESFYSKTFPFEYEDGHEITEPRIYVDEDRPEHYHADTGSGEADVQREYHASPKKIHRHLADWDHGKHESDKKYDPTYTFVEFKDEPYTWYQGDQFVLKALELLGLEDNVFTKPRVYVGKVTFKVFNNSKNMNSSEVALRIVALKKELKEATGLTVLRAGVGGNRAEGPVVEAVDPAEGRSKLELPMIVMVGASLGVLAVGATTFFVLMRRDDTARRKMTGLASAADIDAEATRDYQDLCRARMSGKWVGQQSAPPTGQDSPQRIASLSKEPDNNSPSTRSSTSSWSEEPALTNMDISTGHMVLAYMEDHLKNKDRLEQEWAALCAYEAEPCACAAALRPENANKNRYADLLPYDHARVVLNALSNHLGCDYINASTITDHDPRNPAYIAAAGPLSHTAPDFWQMVWEQGAVVMVMLTRLSEGGQQLCHRYWPEDGSELYHIYEVHLVSEHIWCDDYLVRSFYLKNQKTGETRTVTQFHFLSWPDNGVPSSTKALLEFRRKVNKSYRGRSCPVVVHCSDGASRTGTYCLIDMVLNRMAKGAKEIDIAATLEHIRDQRPRMVATKQQFEFVLMAVAEEVHAILKALPAQLQAQREKDAEKEKEKHDKPAN